MVRTIGGWNLWSGPPGCAGPWQRGAAERARFPDRHTQPPTTAPRPSPSVSGAPATSPCTAPSRPPTTRTGPPAPSTRCRWSSTSQGVVPNESPAGWGGLGGAGPQGQAWGFQELEAQAVAVRSYVMASPGSYGGYADTCDLTCQTYRGTLNESPITDAAAIATAGQVMEFPGGVIAATQYSASTGGYTNPGAFPGVPDAGRRGVCARGLQSQPRLDHVRPGVDHRRHLAPAGGAAVHQHHRPERAGRLGRKGHGHDPRRAPTGTSR